ncbi:MAG: UbiD family decarboxylase [Thermodesulfobacteriota bacterium]|nr:UbiD family decarboxylase [Thermodesulfobacteriota bacterium]
MYKDLREFAKKLREEREVIDIEDELSPVYEVSGVMKYMDKYNGHALFFKRIKGYDFPIIGNLLGRRKRLAIALDIKEDEIYEEYLLRRDRPIKPVIIEKSPAKEIIIKDNINLQKALPVLTHFERDKSPYFTSAVTIAKDPETGIRGMGIHRIQIRGDREIGIALATPPLSTFLKKAGDTGKPLEIAIAIGMDPITFFSSVIWAPEGIDKFDIAGGLAKEPIPLIKCESVDLEVPACAEFILEGKIDSRSSRVREGPLGESTGYYFTFESPTGVIELISYRKDPIYHALMPFTTEESVLMDISWEVDNLKSIKKTFPQIVDMHLMVLGMIAIIQVDKSAEGEPQRIIQGILSSYPFIKMVIVVDNDIDIYDAREVNWAVATRTRPDKDIIINSDLPGFMLDPSSIGGEMANDTHILTTKTSKLGIDATKPLDALSRFEKIDVPMNIRERVIGIIKKCESLSK